jgi:hypothetical protein
MYRPSLSDKENTGWNSCIDVKIKTYIETYLITKSRNNIPE